MITEQPLSWLGPDPSKMLLQCQIFCWVIKSDFLPNNDWVNTLSLTLIQSHHKVLRPNNNEINPDVTQIKLVYLFIYLLYCFDFKIFLLYIIISRSSDSRTPSSCSDLVKCQVLHCFPPCSWLTPFSSLGSPGVIQYVRKARQGYVRRSSLRFVPPTV